MNDDNVGLFHYFFFAVAGLILVYAGEQVKCHPDPIATCLMKFTSVEAAFAIVAMGLSFIPAFLNAKFRKAKETASQVAEQWFSYNGQNLDRISREYVRLIQQKSVEYGRCEAMQDIYHKWTGRFNAVAWTFFLISALQFAIGVCLCPIR